MQLARSILVKGSKGHWVFSLLILTPCFSNSSKFITWPQIPDFTVSGVQASNPSIVVIVAWKYQVWWNDVLWPQPTSQFSAEMLTFHVLAHCKKGDSKFSTAACTGSMLHPLIVYMGKSENIPFFAPAKKNWRKRKSVERMWLKTPKVSWERLWSRNAPKRAKHTNSVVVTLADETDVSVRWWILISTEKYYHLF